MVWPVVIAAMLGVFCGTWLRLLPFTFIILIGALGSVFSMWIGGLGTGWVLLELFAVLTALQAGYLLGLIGQVRPATPPVEGRKLALSEVPRTTGI